MRHLYLNIIVQEGEFEHTHKVLISTKCENLNFAINYYIAHFWGHGELDRTVTKYWWWWDGVHCGRVESWVEVPEEDYEILKKYL